MEGKKGETKILLFTLILVLICLLLLNYFLEGNRKDSIWDYDKITSASELVYLGKVDKDRTTYYVLEGIIQTYLNSYVDTYSEDVKENKISYEEYYNYLDSNYRKHLSKKEYIEVAKKFLDKFYVTVGSEYETMQYMDSEKIIKNIYLFENNVYLCELESSFNEEIGYIALKIDETNNAYKIVYIE